MANVLNKIIEDKKESLKGIKKKNSLDSIENTIKSLNNFLKLDQCHLIFTDLNSNNKKIDISKLTNKPICIIIGPEGDFSEAERKKILLYEGIRSIKINETLDYILNRKK